MTKKNNYRSLLGNVLWAIIVAIILVLIGYFFIDKPVAYFVQNHKIDQFLWLKWFTYPSDLVMILFPLIMIYLLIQKGWKPWSHFQKTLFTIGITAIITTEINSGLKIIFGRYWPTTWYKNNPSLIFSHAYGFHYFHWGVDYESFPSGHTAVIFAFTTVIWSVYPKWRWLCLILNALVIIGLIGLDYHFVSDVIAGAFLGGIIAAFSIELNKLARRANHHAYGQCDSLSISCG